MTPQQYVEQLTPRQREALVLTAKGFKGPEIGRLLNCTSHNVNQLMQKAYRTLEVTNACEASVVAAKAGLV